MSADEFHRRPFDEGTKTKLRIFELYAREWLPVFLSRAVPLRKEVHIFDFFAGPGADAEGTPGSPLRLLSALNEYRSLAGWSEVSVSLHFYDVDPSKIEALTRAINATVPPGAKVEAKAMDFAKAFAASRPILERTAAAKLAVMDQCGVGNVSDETFRQLISFPTCDFLFFISSSILNRFRDHLAIKQKIKRPDDYHHVHRAVVDYYRELIPPGDRYFLGSFSIKKGSNIYGVVFGSAHPLGMQKFLSVAWKEDHVNGEANFDINRDDAGPLLNLITPPTKVSSFESDLDRRIRDGLASNETDVLRVCFLHGVTAQHARPVIAELLKQRVISCEFKVPDVTRFRSPRRVHLV